MRKIAWMRKRIDDDRVNSAFILQHFTSRYLITTMIFFHRCLSIPCQYVIGCRDTALNYQPCDFFTAATEAS
jgi:hypothetical protein